MKCISKNIMGMIIFILAIITYSQELFFITKLIMTKLFSLILEGYYYFI